MELVYFERSFSKKRFPQSPWTFELGTGNGLDAVIYIIVGFQQRDQSKEHTLNNVTIHWPPTSWAQNTIATQMYLDVGVKFKYNDFDYCQGYSHFLKKYQVPNKSDMLQSFSSDRDLKSSNLVIDDDYFLSKLDFRYWRDFTAAHPNRKKFSVSVIVSSDVDKNALVLANNLISFTSDG